MNLIELYLSEVGRHLPKKGRADIQAEIRSTLQDTLDERCRASGRLADDELTLEVLKEFGSPQKVAASYVPQRYVIGPKLYPIFEKAMFAVLPVTILLAFGMAFNIGSSSIPASPVFRSVIAVLGGILWAVFTTAGFLMVIFAIVQWAVPEFKAKEKEWDPGSLTRLPSPDHVSTGKMVAGILFTMAVLLLLDFSPQTFTIGYYTSGAWWVCIACSSTDAAWKATYLSEIFFRYLPFLNILWILTVVLDVLLLRRGRWESWSRWAYISLKALSVGLAAVMISGPSLIGITAASLSAAGFPDAASAGPWIALFGLLIDACLVLTIFFGGLGIVRMVVRLLQARPLKLPVTGA